MRKFFSFLVAAVFVTCAASSVFALGVSTKTLTASVTFSGEGTFWWDLNVHNMDGDAVTSNPITWSGATPGETDWKTADQYIVIQSTITAVDGKIRVYTRNKEGTDFKVVTASSENLGGLVGKTSILPMGWRMDDLSGRTLAEAKTFPVNPTLDDPENPVEGSFASAYFVDKGNWNFNEVDTVDYSSILTSGGMKYGTGPANRTPGATGTFYMFIASTFKGAAYDTYGCDTITFQGINE